MGDRFSFEVWMLCVLIFLVFSVLIIVFCCVVFCDMVLVVVVVLVLMFMVICVRFGWVEDMFCLVMVNLV